MLPDSTLIDLDADSLDLHAIVMGIEEEFEVLIDEEMDLDRLETFRDWFCLVDGLMKGGG